MAVAGIKVSGVRCFSGRRAVDLALDPEPGWTVLAGPNGSGKSALLQALAAALGVYEPGDPGRWLAVGHDEGTIDLDGLGRWRVTPGQVTRTGTVVGRHRYLGTRRTPPEGISDAARALLADGILPPGPELPLAELAELGDGLASLAALVIELADLAGDGTGDGTGGETGGEIGAETDGEIGGGADTPVVLIDDIDAHLHPVWQQRIGGWLTSHFPQVQFIVSTHSPYVCQAADPGTLIRLAGPEEAAAPPRRLGEELHQRVLYGSGDDTVLSELFGLPSAYSPQAEAERQLLVRLERKLYAGEASSSELAEYQKLGAKLNSSLSARADEIAARHLGRER